MILEFLSVSALFQTHTPFDFLFHSFSQQASFGVTVCQTSFKKSESVGYFRSPLGTVGGRLFSRTCPFDNDPVDEGAALLRREWNIRRERVIRPRIDVAFPDNYRGGGGGGLRDRHTPRTGDRRGGGGGGGCAMLGIKQLHSQIALIFIYSM